ncbi:MAG: hypothetical protein ABIP78_00500 [Pyrinomonadaceae bacterium]
MSLSASALRLAASHCGDAMLRRRVKTGGIAAFLYLQSTGEASLAPVFCGKPR